MTAPESAGELSVAELWRYPVKGLRGESLERVTVGAKGIAGDRGLRVVDERGIVTGRRKQRMLGVAATIGDDDLARVDGERWDSDAAAVRIREVAGEGARLSPPSGGHEHDTAPILIVSDGSVAQLGVDRRRFRPNIYLGGADGPVELGWVGRRVRIGELVLSVDAPCERCVITTIDPDTIAVDLDVLKRTRAELDGVIGVYCSVVEPATITVGTTVQVV